MESINVLVTTAIGDEGLKLIAGVSPRIKLTDASELFHSEQGGDAPAKKKLDALLANAEVLFGLRFPANLNNRAPKLKWIQLTVAGVDYSLDPSVLKSPVMVTTASGIHATQISEFVLGEMLMFSKQALMCFDLKQQKLWKRYPPTPSVLHSKTVGIIGLGHIGQEIARLAKAFRMRVLATRRSAKQGSRARYVDELLPREQLRQLLSESDFVVLSLPLTPETTNLIGEKELRAMKPTAYFINIARGAIVDEKALIHALDEKWIAGAGLDVFTTEPLPSESRLWELPNTIISSHISGGLRDYVVPATKLFSKNLERYVNHKRLVNVVDKKKGY